MSTPSNIFRFSNSIMTPGSSLGVTPAPLNKATLFSSTSISSNNGNKLIKYSGNLGEFKDDESKMRALKKSQEELENLLNPKSDKSFSPSDPSDLRSNLYNVSKKNLNALLQNQLRQNSGEIKCYKVEDLNGIFISLGRSTTILFRAEILPRQFEGGNLTVKLSQLFNPKSIQTFKIDNINNIPLGFVRIPGDNSVELKLSSINNTFAIKPLGDRLACGFRQLGNSEFISNCFFEESPVIMKNTSATPAQTTTATSTPAQTSTKAITSALTTTPVLTTTPDLTTTPRPTKYSCELSENGFYISDGSTKIVSLFFNNSELGALFNGIDQLTYRRNNELMLNGVMYSDKVVDSSDLTREYQILANGNVYTLKIDYSPFNEAIKNFTFINKELIGIGCNSYGEGSIKVEAIEGGKPVSNCFLIKDNYLNPEIGSCSMINNTATGEIGQEYRISYKDKYPSTSNFKFEQRLDQSQNFLFKVEFDSKSKSFSIDPKNTMYENFVEISGVYPPFQVDYEDDNDSILFYEDSDSKFGLILKKKENGLFEFLFNDGQVTNCSPLTELESIIKPDHTTATSTSALIPSTALDTRPFTTSALADVSSTPAPSVKIDKNGIVTITTTPSGLLSEKKLTIKIFEQIVQKYCDLSIENKTKTNFADFFPNELNQITNSEQITLDDGNKFNADQLSKNLTLIKNSFTNTTDIKNFENLIDSIEKCEPRKTDTGLVGGMGALGVAVAGLIAGFMKKRRDSQNNAEFPIPMIYREQPELTRDQQLGIDRNTARQGSPTPTTSFSRRGSPVSSRGSNTGVR